MRRLVLTTALPALAILALPMAAQAVEPAPTPPSPVIAGEAPWPRVRPGRPSVKRLDTEASLGGEDVAVAYRCAFWSAP